MSDRKSKAPWVMFDAHEEVSKCLRCGQTMPFEPALVTIFVKRITAFMKIHEDCAPGKATVQLRCYHCGLLDTVQEGPGPDSFGKWWTEYCAKHAGCEKKEAQNP